MQQFESNNSLTMQEVQQKLEHIYKLDQVHREKIEGVIKTYGRDSSEYKKIWEKIWKQDKENLKVVKEILSDFGWLSKNDIGEIASQALFLVIQHSDIRNQKYFFPIMKEFVENSGELKRELAMLEDRICVEENGYQIYGTQIGYNQNENQYFLFPIKEAKTLSIRRENVGMETIEQYIKKTGLDINLDF